MGDRYGLPSMPAVARALSKPVNLLSVIFAQVYFPTLSNRLKEIGQYLGAKWKGPVTSGLQSIIHRREWEKSRVAESKAALVAYNREDCVALETVTSHLTQIIRDARSRADVEFPDKPKQIASVKGIEIHGSFESLLKSAHSRYASSPNQAVAKEGYTASRAGKEKSKETSAPTFVFHDQGENR
jgi:hypothetical protein